MSNISAMHVTVTGHVQGVYYRAYIQEKARRLGLTGYARNLPSGREVEIQAEGEKESLEKLVDYIKSGPPMAIVEETKINWLKAGEQYSRFEVI